MPHMIGLSLVESLCRGRGIFAKVSASRKRLVFYTGDESKPGTWMECGSTMIDDNGMVSRHAVEMILR